MFSHYVRALVYHLEHNTASSAHALDQIEGNILQDFNESVLVGRSLIANNRAVFESSRTYLHFLQKLSKGGIVFTKPLESSQSSSHLESSHSSSSSSSEQQTSTPIQEVQTPIQNVPTPTQSITTPTRNVPTRNSALEADIDSLKRNHTTEIDSLKRNHATEIDCLKRNYATEIDTLKFNHLTQITTLKNNHEAQRIALNMQIESLDCTITTRMQGKLMSTQQSYESQINLLQGEIDGLVRQLNHERISHNSQLQQKQTIINNHLQIENQRLNEEQVKMFQLTHLNLRQLHEKHVALNAEWERLNNLQYEQSIQKEKLQEIINTINSTRNYYAETNLIVNYFLRNPDQLNYLQGQLRLDTLPPSDGVTYRLPQQQIAPSDDTPMLEGGEGFPQQQQLDNLPPSDMVAYRLPPQEIVPSDDDALMLEDGENFLQQQLDNRYYAEEENNIDSNITITMLRGVIEELRQKNLNLLEASAESEELHRKLITKCKDDLTELREKSAKEAEECSNHMKKITDTIKELQTKISRQESECQSLTTENQNLKKELNSKLKSIEIHVENSTTLQAHNQKLQKDNEQNRREMARLQTELQGATEQCGELKRLHQTLSSTYNELAMNHDTLNRQHELCKHNDYDASEYLREQNSRNIELRKRIDQLENEKETLDNTISRLRSDHADAIANHMADTRLLSSDVQKLYKELYVEKSISGIDDNRALRNIGLFATELKQEREDILKYIGDILSEPQKNMVDAVKQYTDKITGLFRRLMKELWGSEDEAINLLDVTNKIIDYFGRITKYYTDTFMSLNSILNLTDKTPPLSIEDMNAYLQKAIQIVRQSRKPTAVLKHKQLSEEEMATILKCRQKETVKRKQQETLEEIEEDREQKRKKEQSLLMDLAWSFNRMLIYKYFELLNDHVIGNKESIDVKYFIAEIVDLRTHLDKIKELKDSIYRTFVFNHLKLTHDTIEETGKPFIPEGTDENQAIHEVFKTFEKKIIDYLDACSSRKMVVE